MAPLMFRSARMTGDIFLLRQRQMRHREDEMVGRRITDGEKSVVVDLEITGQGVVDGALGLNDARAVKGGGWEGGKEIGEE